LTGAAAAWILCAREPAATSSEDESATLAFASHTERVRSRCRHPAPTELTNVSGRLYCEADGELWKSNRTAAGTVAVDTHVDPTAMAIANGTLFFEMPTALWKTRGARATTRTLTTMKLGVKSEIVAVNGSVYFTDPKSGHDYDAPDLWTSNGTRSSRPTRGRGSCPSGRSAPHTALSLLAGSPTWRSPSSGTPAVAGGTSNLPGSPRRSSTAGQAAITWAVRDSGLAREEVFLTTKLQPGEAGREQETTAPASTRWAWNTLTCGSFTGRWRAAGTNST
jgi:hypothetical protein